MKLNIGGGDSVLEGYETVDRKNGKEADLSNCNYAPDSIDAIRASHILEHFSYADAERVLSAWLKVLKPGGVIEISVPDFDKIARAKLEGDPLWRFYAAGGQMNSNDVHLSVYDEPYLTALMQKIGFVNVRGWPGDVRDTSANKISLNLCGMKPAPDAAEKKQTRTAKICAVMSCPRVGWNDFWGEAIAALSPLGIPLRRFTGAFWGQCLQNVLEDLIKEGCDFVITLDYDSMFTKEDIQRLLKDFIANIDEVDALAALQIKRCSDFPLLTQGQKEIQIDTNELKPFQVRTAHFGLTILDLAAVKELPKPWFMAVPGSTGSWRDEDRIDEDIYFWKLFEKHGLKVFVDPAVSIGHLEVMVSGFNKDMQAVNMHVKDWRDARKLEHRTE